MAQVVVACFGAVFGYITVEDFAFCIYKVCRLLAEIFHGHALKLLEADVADGGQNHLVGAVVVGHEVEDVLPMEAFYQFSGTQYVARQRMPFEDHLLKQVVNLIRRRVQIGVDFVQDDFFFLG